MKAECPSFWCYYICVQVICLPFGKIVNYTNAEYILHTITGNYMQKISQTPQTTSEYFNLLQFLDPCPSIG